MPISCSLPGCPAGQGGVAGGGRAGGIALREGLHLHGARLAGGRLIALLGLAFAGFHVLQGGEELLQRLCACGLPPDCWPLLPCAICRRHLRELLRRFAGIAALLRLRLLQLLGELLHRLGKLLLLGELLDRFLQLLAHFLGGGVVFLLGQLLHLLFQFVRGLRLVARGQRGGGILGASFWASALARACISSGVKVAGAFCMSCTICSRAESSRRADLPASSGLVALARNCSALRCNCPASFFNSSALFCSPAFAVSRASCSRCFAVSSTAARAAACSAARAAKVCRASHCKRASASTGTTSQTASRGMRTRMSWLNFPARTNSVHSFTARACIAPDPGAPEKVSAVRKRSRVPPRRSRTPAVSTRLRRRARVASRASATAPAVA